MNYVLPRLFLPGLTSFLSSPMRYILIIALNIAIATQCSFTRQKIFGTAQLATQEVFRTWGKLVHIPENLVTRGLGWNDQCKRLAVHLHYMRMQNSSRADCETRILMKVAKEFWILVNILGRLNLMLRSWFRQSKKYFQMIILTIIFVNRRVTSYRCCHYKENLSSAPFSNLFI